MNMAFPFSITAIALGGFLLTACNRQPIVVVYTSQDEVYAEPILKDFQKETGIQVKTVFDSEAVKTVGLGQPAPAGEKQSAMRRFLEQ